MLRRRRGPDATGVSDSSRKFTPVKLSLVRAAGPLPIFGRSEVYR